MHGIIPRPDGSVVVDGATSVRELNRAMNWVLPKERAATVAGLVIHEAGVIPDVGQVFVFFGYRFEVRCRAANRITNMKVTPQALRRRVSSETGILSKARWSASAL